MPKKFIMFSYKIPNTPSKNKVALWRALKEIGVAYLGHGVALLPFKADLLKTINVLKETTINNGGKASIGELTFSDSEDEKSIILEFNKLRDDEYNEFVKECEKLIFEIDWVIQNEKLTFSEMEEDEEELAKLTHWYEKIQKRDYFKTSTNETAIKALKRAEQKLKEYSKLVYKKEN